MAPGSCLFGLASSRGPCFYVAVKGTQALVETL